MTIDVWYGDGSQYPVGPLQGELIHIINNFSLAKIRITDEKWLDMLSFDDYECECLELPLNHHVRYDAYAWSPNLCFTSENKEIHRIKSVNIEDRKRENIKTICGKDFHKFVEFKNEKIILTCENCTNLLSTIEVIES